MQEVAYLSQILQRTNKQTAIMNKEFFNQSVAARIMLTEINKEIANGATAYNAIADVEHRMTQNAFSGENTGINLLAIMEAVPHIEKHFKIS